VYNRVRAEKKLAGNALSLPARTKTFLRQSRKTEGVSRPKKLNTGLLRLFVQDMHPEKTARSFAAFGLLTALWNGTSARTAAVGIPQPGVF
jgi:hypothetical protein